MLEQYIHISNPESPELTGWNNITSEIGLESVTHARCHGYLINIHLSWKNNSFADDYGVVIANRLRVEQKVKVPIVLYSPLPFSYFQHKSLSLIRYRIFFGRGTAFVELPFTLADIIKVLASIPVLSAATLHDLVTMQCDLNGMVIEQLNHNLRYRQATEQSQKIFDQIGLYLSTVQKDSIDFDKYRNLLAVGQTISQDQFDLHKQQFIQLCHKRLTSKGMTREAVVPRKYKLLLLDDVEEEIALFEKHLGSDFDILSTRNALHAVKLIDEDIDGAIAGVISDWRLYSDETHTFWQPLQGYEVLDYAAQKGNRALFALTSQADFIVHQIRNLQGIRFQIIKKENLSDQQWYILTDLINDACEAAFAGRASLLDDSAVWRQQWTNSDDEPQPSLKQQYISLWNTVDHKIQLQIISELADECWQYLETNPRPYVLGAFPQLTISKKRFVLQDVMVLRRLWYGLWYKYKPPGKFSTERQKELVKKVYMLIFGEPGIGSITQKTNNLCLKIASMDDRLFPEEISWLMGKNLPDNRG